jgi:hypothetical protein
LSKEKEKNGNLGKELNLGPLNLREILTIASDFLFFFRGGLFKDCAREIVKSLILLWIYFLKT